MKVWFILCHLGWGGPGVCVPSWTVAALRLAQRYACEGSQFPLRKCPSPLSAQFLSLTTRGVLADGLSPTPQTCFPAACGAGPGALG